MTESPRRIRAGNATLLSVEIIDETSTRLTLRAGDDAEPFSVTVEESGPEGVMNWQSVRRAAWRQAQAVLTLRSDDQREDRASAEWIGMLTTVIRTQDAAP